jgi:hypothetical protein
MKELFTILDALEKARHTLALYSGDRDAEATIAELRSILDNDELNCAWQKVQLNIASPPIAPDDQMLKKAPIEG